MRHLKILVAIMLIGLMTVLGGCGNTQSTGHADKQVKVIRIGHNQSTNHPTHKGLLAFQKYINENLGDKYHVEIYPSELLGSQNNMVQLTQTGAIDICVASNAILGTFSKNYDIFNLPYLFASPEVYHEVMDDPEISGKIFQSTAKAGFTAVTWLDAGTRNFYTINRPIMKPEDLSGLKIRVQQGPINVKMLQLMGGAATPMGFGEVFTALQSGIIDGAENNEMSLTDNGHGDICKYYSYDMHQMIPDIVIANNKFLEGISAEDRPVFEEGFRLLNQVQREAWGKSVAEAKEKAENDQGVKFLYPDVQPFMQACMPLHQQVLQANTALKPFYERIQEYNQEYLAAHAKE